MKLKLFAVEIQEDETVKVSFDGIFQPNNLDWIKENIGKEIEAVLDN